MTKTVLTLGVIIAIGYYYHHHLTTPPSHLAKRSDEKELATTLDQLINQIYHLNQAIN